MSFRILQADCERLLEKDILGQTGFSRDIDLSFLDPPFNQAKYYTNHNDNMPEEEYWEWMGRIVGKIYKITASGGAIYFMQREKNTEHVLRCLRESGWTLQNLIIWKKMTSAIPASIRFGKQYQIIAFATKGKRPRVFNKLRIDPPLRQNQKYSRPRGMYVTDIWDDIRELTSGYFAGNEPLRDAKGQRFHKQQAPVGLLTRIVLSSSNPGDLVLDPFAGTGTTAVVSEQLGRDSISIELDPENVKAIEDRISARRSADEILGLISDYKYTQDLNHIWPGRLTWDIQQHERG